MSEWHKDENGNWYAIPAYKTIVPGMVIILIITIILGEVFNL